MLPSLWKVRYIYMKTVYLDAITFQCYLSQNKDNTRIPYETDCFDDKCDDYILGFRIVPFGYEWKSPDGRIFSGEMNSAWKPFEDLDSAQRTYEKQLIAQYEVELAELDAALLETQYQNLIGGL